MANVDAPRGFFPIELFSGASFLKVGRKYKKEASVNMAVGDVVVVTGSAEASTGIELVTTATAGAGNRVTGIVVAIEPDRDDLRKKYLATGDSGYVYVIDDPDALFVAQEDSVGGNLAVTDVHQGIDFVTTTPDTVFGRSKAEIDSSSVGNGGTEQFLLMGKFQEPGNDIGANCKWVVKMNYHTGNTAV